MTLNKRERVLMLATIAIVVVVGSYFLFQPLANSYSKFGRDVKDRRETLESYRSTITHKPEWDAEYAALSSRLGQQIESFQQMSEVLKKIEEVAATSKVIISHRKPMIETDRGAYRELPVQCRLEATTESLVKFLYTLRTGSGFLSVQKLEVFSQPNSNVLRCDILIHALAAPTKGAEPS